MFARFVTLSLLLSRAMVAFGEPIPTAAPVARRDGALTSLEVAATSELVNSLEGDVTTIINGLESDIGVAYTIATSECLHWQVRKSTS